MPKALAKQSVLNGRGVVISYVSAPEKWFYRELVAGTKTYKSKLIPNARTVHEAVELCVDVAFALNNQVKTTTTTKPKTGPKRLLVTTCVENWLAEEWSRVEADELSPETWRSKQRILRGHMSRFLVTKGITSTTEIDNLTFRDYSVFRAGSRHSTVKQEIKTIKDFCRNYLVAHKLIGPEVVMEKNAFSKVRITDLDLASNPPIPNKIWGPMIRYVRTKYRAEVENNVNYRYHYWRTLYWHWILFAKNTGMSPEEINRLKWNQIEFIDERRTTTSGAEVPFVVTYIKTYRSKTKAMRTVVTNQWQELSRWKKYLTDYIEKHQLDIEISTDTLVFGNVHNSMKSYSRSSFGRAWRDVLRRLDIKPDEMTGRPYTCYSMRSTFITNLLMKGVDVFTVAELAGHSVRTLQTTYAKLDIKKKGKEIAIPEFGKRKAKSSTVSLF